MEYINRDYVLSGKSGDLAEAAECHGHVTDSNSKPKFAGNVLSFFCGAGGLDLGFAQAGFDICLAADYDAASVSTHNSNTRANRAQKIDLSVVTADEIIKKLNDLGGELPIGIVGGPPCQGFSRANTKRSQDDPRNELAMHYAEMVVELAERLPIKFFLLENVPEILSRRNVHVLDALKAKLSEKFVLSVKCLNAADFGVPQKRNRYFIVGIRTGLKVENFEFPAPSSVEHLSVGSVLKDLPEPAYFNKDLKREDIPHHPNHWTMRPKSKHFGSNLVSVGRSMIRLEWEKPSRTVAYGHREIHVHPLGHRRLSIYEAMLLQGFPGWYRLEGTLSQQVTQISNAVPPPVARALATQISTLLKQIND